MLLNTVLGRLDKFIEVRYFFYEVSDDDSQRISEAYPDNSIYERDAGQVCKHFSEYGMCQIACYFLKQHDTKRNTAKENQPVSPGIRNGMGREPPF